MWYRAVALLVTALATISPLIAADSDSDGVEDAVDNCPAVYNPDQGEPVRLNNEGQELILKEDYVISASDGVHVYFAARPYTPGGDTHVYRGRIGEPAVPLGGLDNVTQPPLLITPDDSRVIFISGGTLISVPTAGPGSTPLTPPSVYADNHRMTPDGSAIVYQDRWSGPLLGPWTLHSTPVDQERGTLLDSASIRFTLSQDSSLVAYNNPLKVVPTAGGEPWTVGPVSLPHWGPCSSCWGFELSPDNRRLVFIAREFEDGPYVPYSVPTTGGTPVKLSGPIDPDGGIDFGAGDDPFLITPDGNRVVFRLTENPSDGPVLFSVPIVGGTVTRLTAASTVAGLFEITSDGMHVVYTGNREGDGTYTLFSVPVGGGPSIELSGIIDAGPCENANPWGTCAQAPEVDCLVDQMCLGGLGWEHVAGPAFYLTSDGSRVVYIADQDQVSHPALYSIPVGGGSWTRLNDPLAGEIGITDVQLTHDGSTVVYAADQDLLDTVELYSAPITGGTPVRLSDPQPSFSSVNLFILNSRDTEVYYVADPLENSRHELFAVALDKDLDGSPDACDVCPGVFDPEQVDLDLDTFGAACDCDDADPDVYPGALEVNDGVDNQCPSDDGYGVIDETSGTSGFFNPDDKTEYSWTAQAGATAYAVARSPLPDFSSGCTTWTTSGTDVNDSEPLPAGGVFHYLTRPTAPYLGSWGQDSTGTERTSVCP